jgi:Putative zinc-finger
MTHLELENLISEYLEGQIAPARRAEFDQHLAACPECQDLVAGVRRVMDLARAAEDLEPSLWLVPRIMAATVGTRVPGFWEEMHDLFRLVFQPKVAYGIAMAVFSFSVIVNAAGLNLRHLTVEDLKLSTWIHRADRNGHLMVARAEKYYYDLKVVYEIESRSRQLRPQGGVNEKPPKPELKPQEAPPGGSSNQRPGFESSQQASLETLVHPEVETIKRDSEGPGASGRTLLQ